MDVSRKRTLDSAFAQGQPVLFIQNYEIIKPLHGPWGGLLLSDQLTISI